MVNIFKSEFKRYRLWAVILMLVHFVAAWFMHAAGFLWLDRTSPVQTGEWMAALCGGALFGLLQIGLHKRPSHWAYLVHRPLSSTKIFLGLTIAALALLSIALFLPALMIIGAVDGFTAQVVDWRHYAFPFQVLGIGFTTYMVGAYTQLYPSKAVFISVALVLYFLVMGLYTTLVTTFAPLLLVCAWLFYLCKESFKPDLTTHFSKPRDIILAALPLQIALALLLNIAQVPFYHVPLLIAGSHPDKNPVPEAYETFRFHTEGDAQATYFLRKIGTERATALIRQAQLGDTAIIRYTGADGRFPLRNNMLVQDYRAYRFFDDDRGIWALSHDQMLIKGYDSALDTTIAWIGQQGFLDTLAQAEDADRYAEVPIIDQNRFIVSKRRVQRIDFDDRLVETVFTLAADEQLTGGITVNEHFAAIASDRRLYLFDLADFNGDARDLEPEYVLAHPTDLNPIGQIYSVKLVDGYLLTYIREPTYREHDVATQTFVVKLDGSSETIGEYRFTATKHPHVVAFNQFVNSPAIAYLQGLVYSFITPGQKSSAVSMVAGSKPKSVWLMAILLCVVSAIAVFVLARRKRLPRTQVGVWTVMTAIVGVPSLISFFILTPWHKRLAPKSK